MDIEYLSENHLENILIMQKQIMRDNLFPDVKLVFSGDEFILAHKVVLAMNSDFFAKCFKSLPVTSDILTILILPDLNKRMMKKFLNFLYLGEVILESGELTEFFEIKNFFGIKSDSFDCIIKKEKPKKFKSKTVENFENIESDQEDSDNIETELKSIKEEKHIGSSNIIEPSIDSEILHKNEKTKKIIKYKFSKVDPIQTEDSITTSTYNLEASELSEEENIPNISQNCYGYTLKNPKCLKSEEIEIHEINYDNDEYENYIESSDYQVPSEERNFTIEEAVKEILEQGVSVTKAAKIYNFSKSALWRRVKHDPRYKKSIKHSFEGRAKVEILSELCERLKNGERLQSISESLKIPISTLHWYKVRLINSGLLPESLQNIRSTLRSDHKLKRNLEKAIEACKLGMVQNKAAKKFGVSKATLFRRMKKLNTE